MKKNSTLVTILFAFISLTTLNSCDKENPIIEPAAWNAGCAGSFLSLDESKTLTKISFASCGAQTLPQPVLTTAASLEPDLFIFLGDNLYADTEDMDEMRDEYLLYCSKEELISLKNAAPIMAVWDDHDYGFNDVGGEYEFKEESKQIFMEFWGETNNLDRMSHLGIYDSKIIGEAGKRVQIILLDTRTFRSKLVTQANNPLVYIENNDPNYTILGAEQWTWLGEQLIEPADVRIIVSSTQFATEYNQFEAWALFPLEQQKMYDLIAGTNASGVLFLSGDVHYSELSKREPSNTYPLYDFTSSGITGVSSIEANQFRVGNATNTNSTGMLEIDWNGNASKLKFSIIDEAATVLMEKEITLSDIQF